MEIDCRTPRRSGVGISDMCAKLSMKTDDPEQQVLLGRLAAVLIGSKAKRIKFWKLVLQLTERKPPRKPIRARKPA